MRLKVKIFWIRIRCKSYNGIFKYEKDNGFCYTKLKAKVALGCDIDLENPSTFNEKLIHRRLFSRDPIWPIITDKIAVREWLKEQGYLDYIHLVTAKSAYSIEELMGMPIDKPVVVKAAWASGMNLFVNFNKELQGCKEILQQWLKAPYAPERLIWAPDKMRRGFLVEDSIADEQGNLPLDYKFFCFDGKVAFMQITFHENNQPKILCFSAGGEEEEWTYVYPKPGSNYKLDKTRFNKMLRVAEHVSKDFSFIRVDLYYYENEIYFGELTQTPTAGFGLFTSPTVKHALGDVWKYPNKDKLGDMLLESERGRYLNVE